MNTRPIPACLPLLLASLACSTLERPVADPETPKLVFEGPGAIFFTESDAAFDALAYAHSKHYPGERPRLLAGTIRRVEGGFTYGEPVASDRENVRNEPTLRHRLGAEDVASYVLYSRSGHRRVDRVHEEPSQQIQHLVEDVDPQHRPCFVLTPALDVVRYGSAETRFLARLGDPRARALAAGGPPTQHRER